MHALVRGSSSGWQAMQDRFSVRVLKSGFSRTTLRPCDIKYRGTERCKIDIQLDPLRLLTKFRRTIRPPSRSISDSTANQNRSAHIRSVLTQLWWVLYEKPICPNKLHSMLMALKLTRQAYVPSHVVPFPPVVFRLWPYEELKLARQQQWLDLPQSVVLLVIFRRDMI